MKLEKEVLGLFIGMIAFELALIIVIWMAYNV
jgi:hypothetical protein